MLKGDDEEGRAHIKTVVNVCGNQSWECYEDSGWRRVLMVTRDDTNL